MIKLVRPGFWERKSFLSSALLVFSYLYLVIFFIKKKLVKAYIPKVRTICVGNISMGGGGKTPTVIAIAQKLQLSGKKVCIITRGYGGRFKGPVQVDTRLHNSSEVGDEPLLLARECNVIVAKNHLQGLKYVENMAYDYVIFDDGLQDFRIKYNVKLLCYHSKTLGNKMVFPAGPLRENHTSCIERVNYILCSEDDKNKLPKEKIITYKVNTSFRAVQNKKYFLFCGLAYPEKFFEFAIANGVTNYVVKKFPDHHKYSNSELNDIITNYKGYILLTSSKDYVRIPRNLKKYFEVLEMSYVFKDLLFLEK